MNNNLDERQIYQSLMKLSGMEIPDMSLDAFTRKILHLSAMIEALMEIVVGRGIATPDEISEMIGRRSAVIASSPEALQRCLGATFVAPFEKPEEVIRFGKESKGTESKA